LKELFPRHQFHDCHNPSLPCGESLSTSHDSKINPTRRLWQASPPKRLPDGFLPRFCLPLHTSAMTSSSILPFISASGWAKNLDKVTITGVTMANRDGDWLKQAEGDLQHSRNALKAGDYNWACLAAQAIADAQAFYDFCRQSFSQS
jgi:hypothetical protein